MVSLGEDGRRSGQGYFFDSGSLDNSIMNQDTDDLIETSQLGTTADPGFRKVRAPFAVILMMFLQVVMGTCLFILPAVCEPSKCKVSALSVLLYMHGVMWFFVMLGDRYLRSQYNMIRIFGYLEFYRQTRNIRRVPFVVFSGGNAILLVIMTLLHDYCPSTPTGKCSSMPLTKYNYLQIICSIEILVVLPVLGVLLARTIRFNRMQATPDVNQDDMMNTYLQSHHHSADIGFRDDDFLDDVLEKQADLIRYLKQHNATLGKKILELTAELQQKA